MAILAEYEIARARVQDIPYLPSIERAAATLLKRHVPDSVLEETTPKAEFKAAQMDDRLWVVRTNGTPVGFAHAETLDPTAAHLKELDVHPRHVRRGLGSRLAWIIHEVSSQKRKDALKGMMNTGFRHPAFPFGASIA